MLGALVVHRGLQHTLRGGDGLVAVDELLAFLDGGHGHGGWSLVGPEEEVDLGRGGVAAQDEGVHLLDQVERVEIGGLLVVVGPSRGGCPFCCCLQGTVLVVEVSFVREVRLAQEVDGAHGQVEDVDRGRGVRVAVADSDRTHVAEGGASVGPGDAGAGRERAGEAEALVAAGRSEEQGEGEELIHGGRRERCFWSKSWIGTEEIFLCEEM